MNKYTIDFSGLIEISAYSESEAMAKFREWIRTVNGNLHLDGYNCIGEEPIEEY